MHPVGDQLDVGVSNWGIILSLKRTVRSIYFSFKLVNYTGPLNGIIRQFSVSLASFLMFNYSVTNNKSGHFLNSICLLKGKLNYSQLPNERLRPESYILDLFIESCRPTVHCASEQHGSKSVPVVPESLSVSSVWEILAASWELLH